jgi:hypothetical protein
MQNDNEDLKNNPKADADSEKGLENNYESELDMMREYANQLNGETEAYGEMSCREDL